MSKVLCLFALVAVIKVASSLDCYTCDANTCKNPSSQWAKVNNCGNSVANSNINTGACLLQTVKTANGEETTRRCVIADKRDGTLNYDQCAKNADGTKALVCQVCNKDYCNESVNGAASVKFSAVSLLGVVAVYLIPRYL